jgi:hypothetical protein
VIEATSGQPMAPGAASNHDCRSGPGVGFFPRQAERSHLHSPWVGVDLAADQVAWARLEHLPHISAPHQCQRKVELRLSVPRPF